VNAVGPLGRDIGKWAGRKLSNPEKSQALDLFLSSVERRAFCIAQITTRDRDEALDLVQDAMLKLVQNYRSRDAAEWRPLFYRILQRRIQDWRRRTWVRNRWRVWYNKATGEDGGEREDPIERAVDPACLDPADQMSNKRAVKALRSELQELPFRQRQVFLLRAWEGFGVEETARTMGCSAGSVKTHYSRAVHVLRERLKGYKP